MKSNKVRELESMLACDCVSTELYSSGQLAQETLNWFLFQTGTLEAGQRNLHQPRDISPHHAM